MTKRTKHMRKPATRIFVRDGDLVRQDLLARAALRREAKRRKTAGEALTIAGFPISIVARKAAKKREREIGRGYRKRIMNDDNSAATALTRARHVKPSFARMCDKGGGATGPMVRAAQEIDRVYMALTSGLVMGSISIEPRSRGGVAMMPEQVATAHAKRYKPWAKRLSDRCKQGGYPALEIVIDVVIDGRTLSTIDTERRYRHGTAKWIVMAALTEYAVMAGWAPHEDLDRLVARRVAA